MKTVGLFAGFLIVVSSAVAAPSTEPARNALDRGQADVRAYEKADEADSVKPGGIVFCGSSTIYKWTTLKDDLPGLDVLNRGVNGWTVLDVVRYSDRIVLKYQPRTIVFYAGDNDLTAPKVTPMDVAAHFKTFVDLVHQTLPRTKIVFLSIKPSPLRIKLMDAQKAVNTSVQQMVKDDSRLFYVDVFTPMLDDAGVPKPELYVKDRLHLSPAGYEILTREVLPVLKKLEAEAEKGPASSKAE